MELIQLTELVTPSNRQRREFNPEKIQELAEKIYQLGLFHPLVVRNDGKTLVAGERRKRAIEHLAFLGKSFNCGGRVVVPGMIPVLRLAELSVPDVYEAELTENVVRQDLTWQEWVDACARLADLRGMKAGEPVSVAELAEEIHGRSDGDYHNSVRQALIVSKYLDIPEVQNSRTLKDAMKVLKMKEQQRKYAEAGARLPSEILKGRHRLLIGDFRSVELPLNYFSVSITDPPYGIEADEYGTTDKATAGHTYDDPVGEIWTKLMWDIATTLWSISTENSHHYLFCDFRHFPFLRDLWLQVGYRVWPVPFVMYRTTSVRAPWQECGPWRSSEFILYAMKGRRACNLYRTDVITVRGDENLGHGAQKPIQIYTDFLERSARPEDQVIDLCCGTGTIFPAAHTLKCIATGVELEPQNAAIAAKRLEELK